jgi:ABC-type methionine transport system ATPase subunit
MDFVFKWEDLSKMNIDESCFRVVKEKTHAYPKARWATLEAHNEDCVLHLNRHLADPNADKTQMQMITFASWTHNDPGIPHVDHSMQVDVETIQGDIEWETNKVIMLVARMEHHNGKFKW